MLMTTIIPATLPPFLRKIPTRIPQVILAIFYHYPFGRC